MAITKSSYDSQPTAWWNIHWGFRTAAGQPEIPSPNLGRFNKEAGEMEYILQPGERPGINVTGKITHATVFPRAGFNDREKNKSLPVEKHEKNEYVLMLTVDSGEAELTNLTAVLVSDQQIPNRNTVSLLNTVIALAESDKRDGDISLGLYRRRDNNYPGVSIRAPKSYGDDNQPIFDFKDESTLIKVAEKDYMPQPQPFLNNGQPIMNGDRPVLNWQPVLDWLNERVSKLRSEYPTADEREAQAHAEAASADAMPPEHEGDTSVGDALGEGEDESNTPRQRMTG